MKQKPKKKMAQPTKQEWLDYSSKLQVYAADVEAYADAYDDEGTNPTPPRPPKPPAIEE